MLMVNGKQAVCVVYVNCINFMYNILAYINCKYNILVCINFM